MKKTAKTAAGALALITVLTGCAKGADIADGDSASKQSAAEKQTDGLTEQETKDTPINGYGASVTVGDIKKAYGYDDSNDIMPLYNVSETESFEFKFNFNAYESDVDLYDFVTVHTDAACESASRIYYTASLSVEDEASTLTVAPMEPVMGNDSQENDYVYENVDSWGNAPIYYIALHYELEADSPKKLEEPVVIPFTVKHEVTAPTLRAVISDTGRLSLEWDAVEGAEKYIIYKLDDDKLYTGKDNHAIDGAKNGYDCAVNVEGEPLYFRKDGETTECSFDGFSGPNSHGIAEVESFTGSRSNSGQNFSVNGEYYITAVVNGIESGLSNAVATAGMVLPYKIVEEDELEGRYPTPADFPSEVRVLNIDGSETVRAVSYERTHVNYFDLEWDEYIYTVEGTYIYGTVGFDEDEGEPVDSSRASAENGNTLPKDEVDRIPDAEVDTIIPADGGEDYTDGALIENQSDNTKKHLENGNGQSVQNVPDGVYINADSAEEEWLALNLVQGNSEISVEGFTSLQDPYTLIDVFYKVYYQNPYIMGISSFSYDYGTMLFKVNFVYDRETIAAKQAAIAETAAKVIGETVTQDMKAEEKILALYNYLVNNAVYDNDALEDAKKNGYVKTESSQYEDSFNTYGVLVAKKGVCMSYAYAFRLLCDLAGAECAVVTGYLDGTLPHAWNTVKINGEYYEIDCTNNAVNTGIPYFLYQADSALAESAGYKKDDLFWTDAELPDFDGDDGSLEYYRSNGLCPESMEELKSLITSNVTADTRVFAVRWQGALDKTEFNRAVVLAYNELGLEDKLNTLKYSVTGGFIILLSE
ncbi:MAG: hypothetical protein NC223_04315 [Butyrivibrio sp.]|nr:hypothetical protein [Butyrivibrio sp.]